MYKPLYRNTPWDVPASRWWKSQLLTRFVFCWAAWGTSTEQPCLWKLVSSTEPLKSVRTQISFAGTCLLRGIQVPWVGFKHPRWLCCLGGNYCMGKNPCSDCSEPGKREKWEVTNQKEGCRPTGISCEINGEPGRAVKWREPRFLMFCLNLQRR